MTTSSTTVAAARPRRLSPAETSVLLIVAAGAWLATIAVATDMDAMPGTMGLGLVGFLGAWTLMMAAMMLPSVTPLTSLYARTMRGHRVRRVSLLAAGYLAVWAAAGLVAFLWPRAPNASPRTPRGGRRRSPSPRAWPVASTK